MRPAPHPLLDWTLKELGELHRDPGGRKLTQVVALAYARPPGSGLPPWPEDVAVPFGLTWDVMRKSPRPDHKEVARALGFHVLTLWRLTKGAYLFDEDVLEELLETPLDRLPREALHLPEPCPLILFPKPLPLEKGLTADGAHLFLDWHPPGQGEAGHLEFRSVFWARAGDGMYEVYSHILDLDAPTLGEAVRRTLTRTLGSWQRLNPSEAAVLAADALESAQQLLERLSRWALNLALYLSQPEPDLGGMHPPPPPQVKRVKGGIKVFPAEAPTLIPTGWRWGKALRLAREAARREEPGPPTGRSITPHVRRAHWHLYWTGQGARKDPSKAVPKVRWMPATLVGRRWLKEAGLSEEDLPAVVRRVNRKKG